MECFSLRRSTAKVATTVCLLCSHLQVSLGQSSDTAANLNTPELAEAQWERIDEAAQRGFKFLAAQQLPNGMFMTDHYGQPGVTGLATMAFMAWGHEPGSGPYGDALLKAVHFIADQQRENGVLSSRGPKGRLLSMEGAKLDYCVPASYNHAIGGLALCEVYGVVDSATSEKIYPVIEKAVEVTVEMQKWRKARMNAGGWRYLHTPDSDLSVTGWHLMFLRAAKNAGFDVPQTSIDEAVGFIRSCYHGEYQTFEYDLRPVDRRTRAMAAAGILALAHAGLHNSAEARGAADWILEHRFDRYNKSLHVSKTYRGDRYHYGVFYCSQAMYQMGGHYWEEFFPTTAKVLLDHQNSNGSWEPESNHDMRFGRSYTTSLALLALGAPNQLLPIFQR